MIFDLIGVLSLYDLEDWSSMCPRRKTAADNLKSLPHTYSYFHYALFVSILRFLFFAISFCLQVLKLFGGFSLDAYS